jgi:hypothetical protein
MIRHRLTFAVGAELKCSGVRSTVDYESNCTVRRRRRTQHAIESPYSRPAIAQPTHHRICKFRTVHCTA